MNGTLKERDLQKIASIHSLPVIEEDDWRAKHYFNKEKVCEFAEAADAIRLCELLHRSEYQPFAVVREGSARANSFRVYFRQLHETVFSFHNQDETDRPSRPMRFLPR